MSSLYLNLIFCSLERFGRETLIVSPLSSLALLGPFNLKRGFFVGGSADAVESTISADFLACAIPRLVDSVYFFNLAVEIRSVKWNTETEFCWSTIWVAFAVGSAVARSACLASIR